LTFTTYFLMLIVCSGTHCQFWARRGNPPKNIDSKKNGKMSPSRQRSAPCLRHPQLRHAIINYTACRSHFCSSQNFFSCWSMLKREESDRRYPKGVYDVHNFVHKKKNVDLSKTCEFEHEEVPYFVCKAICGTCTVNKCYKVGWTNSGMPHICFLWPKQCLIKKNVPVRPDFT
jgi:hypothetical protein